MFQYSYDQNDFISTDVDPSKLQELISLSIGTPISHIDISKNGQNFDISIYFENELTSSELVILNTLIQNYTFDVYSSICVIKDSKPAGTNGGTFNKNIWTQRNLNTVEGKVDFLTLENNQITLSPGIYLINVKAPACNVQSHQALLKNVTDNIYIMGINAYSNSGLMTNSEISACLDLKQSTNFNIQHICGFDVPNIGFGRATGFNSSEIYTTVTIQKF